MAIKIIDAHRTMAINFAAGIPLMFQGASGIGKTELSEAYAYKQGDDYGLFELNCATALLPDVIGFMITQAEKFTNYDGQIEEIIAAKFAYPYFMRDKRTGRPARCFNRGMVVLEEYGQGQPDVKRALAPIIREKRAGMHLFPTGTDILLLSNRPEDRSGVTKDFDFLINRRNQMEIVADLDGWLVWAQDNGVSLMAMAFASRNTDKVFSNKAPEKQGAWLTPRSLVNADKFIHAAMGNGLTLDNALVRENLAGMIGEGNAHVFIAFARLKDGLPTIPQILKDPEGTKVPAEADQQMFLVFDMASKATKANIKEMTRYLKRLPSDFAVTFWRSAGQRDVSLQSTKEFGDYSIANVDMLKALNI